MRQHLRRTLLRVVGALLRFVAPHASAPPRRVLIIKPDHLGDVLLLTPALRLLRETWPHVHVTLLIGPWSTPTVAHNPDIDTVLTCPFPGFTRATKPGVFQPYMVLLKLALLLRAGRYDAAVIARDDHWWGALAAALAGIPERLGFAVPETAPFLTRALPHSFATHVAAQSLALVQALTGQAPPQRVAMRAPISAADQVWAKAWLQHGGVAPQPPLVALHPGAGGPAKLWLPERWIEVGTALQQRGFQLVLTGGPQEGTLVERIAQGLPQRPLVMVGEATIGQLAALYSRCVLVLGVDSGPLHLAAAAGVTTLALFGPGDHRRFGPWGAPDRHVVLRSGLWCSPCGVLEACPRGTAPSECMTLLTPAQLLAAVDQLLPAAS